MARYLLTSMRYTGIAVLFRLLYFTFTVFLYFVAVIDQPRPDYAIGHWTTHRMASAVPVGVFVGMAMFAIVLIDLIARHSAPNPSTRSYAYFPRFHLARKWLLTPGAGLILIGGLFGLGVWYTLSVIEVFTQRQFAGGLVWPPERLFAVMLMAWALFWVVDCWTSPENSTLIAALLFAAFVFIFIVPLGYGILRE
jgi:hypothetical protein